MDYPITVKRLTIETNHGFVQLDDVTITREDEGRYSQIKAAGTCTGGGETSRLFHVSSTRQFPTGVPRTEWLWRDPWCSDKGADHWFASRVSCG